MFPILYSIGKVNFYSYGLMAAMAFLATTGLIVLISKKEKIYSPELWDKLIIIFIFGLIGARISYFIAYYNQFQHWYEIFYLWDGGMISYGGILGVIIAACYFFKKDIFRWLDIMAVAFLLGLFFWRMGCFLAGDHPQVASNAFFAIKGEFPAILLESFLGLIGFPIFYLLYNKLKNFKGIIFFSVLIYYGLVRILVDNFRIDAVFWGLKSGQWVGIFLAIAGVIGIIMVKMKNKVNNS